MMENKAKNPVDVFLRSLIEEHLYEIAMAVLILIAIVLKFKLASFKFNGEYISGDYQNYLRHWVDVYRQKGIIEGLSRNVGDYYVPYNIILAIISAIPIDDGLLISFVSIAGEFMTSFFIFKLGNLLITGGLSEKQSAKSAGGEGEKKKYSKRAAFTAIMYLYLPLVMLNSTLWKQCDAWYTSFIMMGLYNLFSKKHRRAFVFFAVAFIFKLQTLFLAPFLIIVYMLFFEYSIFEFLWFPGLYLLAGIPAILCERPAIRTYLTYVKQSNIYKMSIGLPNVYCLGIDSYEALGKPAILITIAILVIISCVLCAHREKLRDDSKLLFLIAGFIEYTCVMFLPAMHERYDYVAIVIITAFAFCFDIRMLYPAVIMNVCSIFTYGSYLFHNGDNLIPYQPMALLYLTAYIYTACYIFISLRRELKCGRI